jgi:UDP-N-acetylglucosamine 2-epimerase (non-hydrolysing)
MKILLVAGTRPNFIKIAPLMEAMSVYPQLQAVLLHTGQHYDYEMSLSFFQQLGIREPDVFLGVGSGSHAGQTAEILVRFEKVVLEKKPDLVVVVGDVNSTLAAALAAVKVSYAHGKRPRIAHVEAGLRSFDWSMPEEINRMLTDAISDYLFTTCEDGNKNLAREGIAPERIFFVGNVMIDTLLKNLKYAKLPPFLNAHAGRYALLTLHRPSNVDNRDAAQCLVEAMSAVAEYVPVLFPAHPRTQKMFRVFGLEKRLAFFTEGMTVEKGRVYVMNPVPYLEFIGMVRTAAMVLTDSGGIQEETTVLGVPCLTLRENTERPVTIRIGTNVLVGTNRDAILSGCRKILAGRTKSHRIPELWDGHAAERIAAVLAQPEA